MDMESYEQLEIPKNVIGPLPRFLKENDEIDVEFFEGKALSIHHAPTIIFTVTATGAGIKDAKNYKDATLENGVELQVTQFVKEGDSIHVDIETGKYHDRVKGSTYGSERLSLPRRGQGCQGAGRRCGPIRPKKPTAAPDRNHS